MSDDEMSPAERPYEDVLDRQIDEGAAQIERTARGLTLSSLAAGLFIGFGPLLMAVVHTVAADVYREPTLRFLLALMYSVGFIFVVLSQTDLYTELDTRAAFPVFKGKASVVGLGRLYAFTIVFNIIGGIIASFVMVYIGTTYGFVEPSAFEHLATVYTQRSTWQLFLGSIIAGWLMGLLAWLTVAASGTGSRTFFVVLATGGIAFMHLPHSIAGNVEVFMGLLVDSPVTWFDWGRFLIATIIGNALGGVVFVALIAYGGRKRNDNG
jgi:formate/nitrite transporter FocA (FNT family)